MVGFNQIYLVVPGERMDAQREVFDSSPLKNGWLEDDPFLFGMAYFQGRTVKLRKGISLKHR